MDKNKVNGAFMARSVVRTTMHHYYVRLLDGATNQTRELTQRKNKMYSQESGVQNEAPAPETVVELFLAHKGNYNNKKSN